jgi:hypothetical protein
MKMDVVEMEEHDLSFLGQKSSSGMNDRIGVEPDQPGSS